MSKAKIKIISAIIISILLFVFIFIAFDIYFYLKIENHASFLKYFSVYKNKTTKELINDYVYKNDKRIVKKYPKIENKDSKLSPLLLFGDSFIYSNRLDKDKTLAKIIAKHTKRPIYDQSTPYVKPQHILFELKSDELYKTVPKPDFIITLYVSYHNMEVYTKCASSSSDLFYKIKKNKLKRYEKVPFYKKSFLLAHINAQLFKKQKFNDIYFNLGKELYKRHILESLAEAKKHWGDNVKFIIIRYLDNHNPLEDKMFEELKKEGVIVFEMYKYIDTKQKKYQTKTKPRPNSLLWETIMPVMIEKTGI